MAQVVSGELIMKEHRSKNTIIINHGQLEMQLIVLIRNVLR